MEPISSVVGTRFPGGTYRIDPVQNETVCRLLGARPAADGTAHAIYGYIATRCGCGFGVDEILAVADAKVEEGPMLASLDLDYRSALRVGETYRVSGEFTSLERKQGRRAGAFDLLQFELRLTAPGDDVVVACTQSWVLPRGNDEHA